jgi:signal transduction histidine kinase
MHDWYQMPALILTTLLLPAFGHLYLRSRDIRNLLWFLAFACVVARMFLLYPGATWDLVNSNAAWAAAVGQVLAMLAAGLFVGSLSPLSFWLGRHRVLYAIPFTVPLMVYAALEHGLYHHSPPTGAMFYVIFPSLAALSLLTGLQWARARGSLPAWIGFPITLASGAAAFWFYIHHGIYVAIVLAECGAHIIAALLVISVFRRFSPGVVVTVLGFLVWAMPILLVIPEFQDSILNTNLTRAIVLAKVAVALGLIVLSLENELAVNIAARDRERRARREMEAYAALVLSRRRVEDFDRQGEEVCSAVVLHSRFSQAALVLLHSSGIFRVEGSAGLDRARVHALNSLVNHIPLAEFLAFSRPVANGQTVNLEFHPWLQPGDDLERLNFTSALAAPLNGRAGTEGALLLAGLRNPDQPLSAEDLVPVEILAARMQSVRSQTRMLEKLIDSEKFAALGQLSGNVTQQLNNPLTVILGYAALLEDALRADPADRKAIESILASARSMRSTLESLQRVARSPGGLLVPVSVSELLADMERLHRREFLERSIEFRLHIAPDLPEVRAQAQQLRQAVLHCLQYAMDAVDRPEKEGDRTVRLEASAEGSYVQILIAHTGLRFDHPERAFDPFVPAQAAGETAALGLSLCATILRENRGYASAVNLEPKGAAIVLELQAT